MKTKAAALYYMSCALHVLRKSCYRYFVANEITFRRNIERIMGVSLPIKCWSPNFHSIHTESLGFITHEIHGGSDFQIHGIFIPHENLLIFTMMRIFHDNNNSWEYHID